MAIFKNVNLKLWGKSSLAGKPLNITLVAVIFITFIVIVYVLAVPRTGERYTEFYITGTGGDSSNYPSRLQTGEQGRVNVVIINHEHRTTAYLLEIVVDGEKQSELAPIVVEYEEKWQREASFVAAHAGEHQKVEFLLYKQNAGKVYRSLYLFVDVEAVG